MAASKSSSGPVSLGAARSTRSVRAARRSPTSQARDVVEAATKGPEWVQARRSMIDLLGLPDDVSDGELGAACAAFNAGMREGRKVAARARVEAAAAARRQAAPSAVARRQASAASASRADDETYRAYMRDHYGLEA